MSACCVAVVGDLRQSHEVALHDPRGQGQQRDVGGIGADAQIGDGKGHYKALIGRQDVTISDDKHLDIAVTAASEVASESACSRSAS